ncbi:globin-5-like [Haliotis rufescens]|uniref:globin-5-like n=1 Tax=Haliotis rufescens TaxID=6454 RepID=UPI001EB04935|nr:globin-5-like [Haliotis rufescens]
MCVCYWINTTVMGCLQSRSGPQIQREVASAPDMADGFCDPAPPAPTDPRLPLSALQVFKLKKSWKGIKRCMEATGVEMFIRLFKANGDLKQLFSSFRDLTNDDDLRVNENLEKHATLVMGIFDEAISNVDNVDYTLDVLQRAGGKHTRFPGFQPDLFVWMEQPFLEAVKQTLGDRYTDNMDVIYKITIKFILDNMVKGNKNALS